MRDWLEIEERFRRLSEPLQHIRIDFQWGAAGEHWRIAGESGSPLIKEFEAIAAIAGRHLESVLPQQGEAFEKISGESSKNLKWYRAVKELTDDFEFNHYGTQIDGEGNAMGNIYSGTVPHPVLSSANLCLYLHANYPIKDNRSIMQRLYDDYGKKIVIGVILALLTALIGLMFT